MEHTEHGHRHRRRKKHDKHVVRQTISYILAFLLSVCLTLITLLIVVKFGCFSEKALYKNMSSYGYYDYVYTDIMADVKSMTIPTGFPETIYQDVITQTYVATEAEEVAIGEYLNAVATDYDNYIKMPLGNYLMQIKNIFDKIFLIAIIALTVVSAIIVYVILQLYKWVHRAFRFFSYAAFGCTAMVTAFPAYLYLEKIHYRFNVSPESFYKLITTYVDNLLELFMYFGLLWLVIGIVFICVTILAKKHQKLEQN